MEVDGRSDGRGFEELRDIKIEIGRLTRSTGSAYCEVDTTKVLVAVQGPRQSDAKAQFTACGELNVTVDIAPFSGFPVQKGKAPNIHAVQLAHHVKESLKACVLLERYAKSVVDVHCSILENGGSTAAALISAASLAIIDAGIECRCILSAACIVTVGENLLVDPTQVEEDSASGSVVMAMDVHRQQVAHIDVSGVYDPAQLRDALGLALSAGQAWEPELRKCLMASYFQVDRG